MRRLNVAELTADTDTALQYEAEVKNYFQTLESIEEDKMVEPMQIAARWKQYCQELSEDNNDSVNLPQSVHMQPEPSPLRPEVA